MYFKRFDPLRGERLEVMDREGVVDDALRPELSDERIVHLYERMTAIRTADQLALRLQREGRMGTYAPMLGQEACQAAAAAMEEDDWLVPEPQSLASTNATERPRRAASWAIHAP